VVVIRTTTTRQFESSQTKSDTAPKKKQEIELIKIAVIVPMIWLFAVYMPTVLNNLKKLPK